jgi:hypothetical protein
MEFQIIGYYMNMKELGSKNCGIQHTGIEDSKGNIRVYNRRVMKILENYITELYNRPNRPQNLEVETEEEADADEKGPYILQCEVEKSIKVISIRRLEEMTMYLGMYSKYWKKMVSH